LPGVTGEDPKINNMSLETAPSNAPMAAPAATVVMPVYNGAPWLKASIESILGQTRGDFEFLIIDDGSKDASVDIVRGYAARDKRIVFTARENRGPIITSNEGTERARGRYIVRMDQDDISRPTRIEKQVAYLDAHPEVLAVGSRLLLIDPDGLPMVEAVDAFTHAEIDAGNLSGHGAAIYHASTTMRRDAMQQLGGYRQQYASAEDLDLYLRMGEVGVLANLDEILLDYRQHLGSVGHARREAQVRATRGCVAEARQRRGLQALPPELAAANADGYANAGVVHRKWGWWSLGGGHPSTARKHALQAIRHEPFKFENLKLLACALRAH
jgi:glycosyltransferase involved in cell wall biosynthesis